MSGSLPPPVFRPGMPPFPGAPPVSYFFEHIYLFSLIYLFYCMYSLIHSCIHSFIHSFMHSFIHSFMHSFIHSFTHFCFSLVSLFLSYSNSSCILVCDTTAWGPGRRPRPRLPAATTAAIYVRFPW